MTLSPEQRKRTAIFCHACQKRITGARTVIDGQWHCADCTYAHDNPDVGVPRWAPRERAKPYDGPALFEATGYIKTKEQPQR